MEALAGAYARADAAVKPAVFAGLKAALGLDLAGPGGLSPLTAGLPGLESPTPLLCWMATYLVVISLGLAFRTPKRKGAEDQQGNRPHPDMICPRFHPSVSMPCYHAYCPTL